MVHAVRRIPWALIIVTPLLLTACGGGGDGGSAATTATASATLSASQVLSAEPGAPQATGNTATDGVNWFNFRRQQIGLAALTRNAQIDTAAQRHSTYQQLNNTITHVQTEGVPGFTGKTLADRLTESGYRFTQNSYAFGEVIASTGDTSGFSAAEDLIAAIYHRFVAFEPMFKEIGAGAATISGGNTFFTADFAANGLDVGVGSLKAVTYPFANQQRVPRNFFSDNESPDPVPDRNEVGYPISVHVDITSTLTMQSFTVRPRGGSPLAVRVLTKASDTNTPISAVSIIPLDVLAAGTTYDVQFLGTVRAAGATAVESINRSWSFTTR